MSSNMAMQMTELMLAVLLPSRQNVSWYHSADASINVAGGKFLLGESTYGFLEE